MLLGLDDDGKVIKVGGATNAVKKSRTTKDKGKQKV
jgi:hypothetical protein